MRAVVSKATREVAVEDVPDARVERDDDVVVRVTSSALCGTDLHMYDGRTGAAPGMVLGHEGLGIVEDVGRAVCRVQRGDRVVLPAHIYCGVCFNCARGDSAACLRVHTGHVGGAYAMPGMGPFRGSQAERCGFRSRMRTAWCCPVPPVTSTRTTSSSLLTRG